MNRKEFEKLLKDAVDILTEKVRASDIYHGPEKFEQGVEDMLRVAAKGAGLNVERTFHPHAFPDLRVGGFGVEVKYTKQDSWSAVGNSVFEGMRDSEVKSIYVVFGKIGGRPEVRWRRYEDCVTDVRVSNSPRFVIEMDDDKPPLFEQLPVSYDRFARLTRAGKMRHVRDYARERLREGERLWWLDASHTLPIKVRVYRTLDDATKRQMRAEGALLCPEIVQPASRRGKYDQVGLYLITQRAVFTPQLRDLFTAGSVGAKDGSRGHKYIISALRDLEPEMRRAARELDDSLFQEYWGVAPPPGERITEWLRLADQAAEDWKPSDYLFLNGVD